MFEEESVKSLTNLKGKRWNWKSWSWNIHIYKIDHFLDQFEKEELVIDWKEQVHTCCYKSSISPKFIQTSKYMEESPQQ